MRNSDSPGGGTWSRPSQSSVSFHLLYCSCCPSALSFKLCFILILYCIWQIHSLLYFHFPKASFYSSPSSQNFLLCPLESYSGKQTTFSRENYSFSCIPCSPVLRSGPQCCLYPPLCRSLCVFKACTIWLYYIYSFSLTNSFILLFLPRHLSKNVFSGSFSLFLPLAIWDDFSIHVEDSSKTLISMFINLKIVLTEGW